MPRGLFHPLSSLPARVIGNGGYRIAALDRTGTHLVLHEQATLRKPHYRNSRDEPSVRDAELNEQV